ncbi:histidine kinase [Tolypothrix sp. NIES-4075]|uniref:DICT sensory domain-containing protein n=1 Tax=Tolypothrix sp. NIES-4075 TaxID=2005459 RepID=UPI000B5C5A2A|nr:DICT sensory domain-containing protein [Tolypothrix sp. NIES-4075]GAX45201.1 histidine kinase [Tolypothrix sp. NIES-4075]
MNVSLAQDLSIYQLALSVQTPPQPLSLSPATLLSLVRSQIDLLIEQKIAATLWVKLPPQKIWQSELARYHSWVKVSDVIYSCDVGSVQSSIEVRSSDDSNAHFGKSEEKGIISSLHHRQVQLLPHSQLRREYFLMVLSPQFCSLILAQRCLTTSRFSSPSPIGDATRTETLTRTRGLSATRSANASTPKIRKTPKTKALLTINTFEGRIIQRVLDGIKQATAPDSFSLVPADFICPSVPDATLMSSLLQKQLQRQEEINRQIAVERSSKVQQQNQKQHNKEELKDEYLNNVCQELRSPLTHMKTALSLLNSPNLKPPQRQRYLQMLNNLCDRQSSLITGLLDLVELERNLDLTTLESVRLSEIVPGVVSTYQPLAQEKGILLAYTVPNDLPAVRCVTGRLRQIVINLLHNSIKFTPNGGQVSVRAFLGGTSPREGIQKASTTALGKSNYVQLEFRDTGIGIAENEIPKIFDRFYRVRSGTTEDKGGAGLGLMIVQQLLRHCGGSISVKSKLSEGSIFTVQLVVSG